MPPALVREVPVHHRSLAVLAAWITAATVGAVVVVDQVFPHRCHVYRSFEGSKTDIARVTARKYVFEAFPSWREAHPDRACPAQLEELGRYMDDTGTKDPWGQPYYWACGRQMVPSTTPGFWVLSAGEDGQFGTADDIRSDDGKEY